MSKRCIPLCIVNISSVVICLANDCDATRFPDLNLIFYAFSSCNVILISTIGFLGLKIIRNGFTFFEYSKNKPFPNILPYV